MARCALIKVRKERECSSDVNRHVRGMIDEHFLLFACESKDKTFKRDLHFLRSSSSRKGKHSRISPMANEIVQMPRMNTIDSRTLRTEEVFDEHLKMISHIDLFLFSRLVRLDLNQFNKDSHLPISVKSVMETSTLWEENFSKSFIPPFVCLRDLID